MQVIAENKKRIIASLIGLVLIISLIQFGKPLLAASTTNSSWKTASIDSVTITHNNSKYNETYLESKIDDDSFAAQFLVYTSTGKCASYIPVAIRCLYGSASVVDAEAYGTGVRITYSYEWNSADVTAEVVVDYAID